MSIISDIIGKDSGVALWQILATGVIALLMICLTVYQMDKNGDLVDIAEFEAKTSIAESIKDIDMPPLMRLCIIKDDCQLAMNGATARKALGIEGENNE